LLHGADRFLFRWMSAFSIWHKFVQNVAWAYDEFVFCYLSTFCCTKTITSFSQPLQRKLIHLQVPSPKLLLTFLWDDLK